MFVRLVNANVVKSEPRGQVEIGFDCGGDDLNLERR